ncbi:HNH endonuclease [Vibrio albus]|uniref:HNH endonuclease n=1 Tax=Vibrio albus TaxID=2200953 RepID=A0A2U3BD68_9VIBR|nr:HNH endonuclease [Vibrio albus]PWI34736.1 HNH endonuclease [Vibrio albus]
MKLSVTFSGLAKAVQLMNPSEKGVFTSGSDIGERDPIGIQLAKGVEVDLSEVETISGLLSYQGRQVLLYIRDHGAGVRKALEDGSQGRKYHLADCKVLQEMREKGRFERYVVTNDTSDMFSVTGYDRFTQEAIEGETDLKVCKVCLRHLNYKGYQVGGNKGLIFNSFAMDEFFSTYSSHFLYMPTRLSDEVNDGYSPDWARVSANYKQKQNFTCEKCGVVLDKAIHRHLLHTHHINGVKSDNKESNLRVLCADCHSKEAFHEHMFVPRKDKHLIIELRKRQSILNDHNNWQELFEYSDAAVHGVLHMCQQRRTNKPEVGMDIVNTCSEVVGCAELAWPDSRLAIVLDDEEKSLIASSGWQVVRTDEFIEGFATGIYNQIL